MIAGLRTISAAKSGIHACRCHLKGLMIGIAIQGRNISQSPLAREEPTMSCDHPALPIPADIPLARSGRGLLVADGGVSCCTITRPDSRWGSVAVVACRFLLLLLLMVPPQEGRAAEVAEIPTDTPSRLSPAFLKGKIREIEKTTTGEEGTKKKLLALYRTSLENLETAASSDLLADTFVQAIETAPVKIKKIREEIEASALLPPAKEVEGSGLDSDSLKDVEQQFLKAKAHFTVREADVIALTRQLSTQSERPIRAGQRLAEIKRSEEELLAAPKGAAAADESPPVTEALRWLQGTQLKALHSEKKMLNQELVSMPMLIELANAQLEEAKGRLEQARSQMQRLEAKVNRQRQDEAAKSVDQAEEAMRQVADGLPVLQQAAAINTTLGDELQAVTVALERYAAEKEHLAREVKKLEESFKNTKQKIELAGLSKALGLMLHELRRTLPNARVLRKKVADNEAAIAETGLLQVQHGEDRKRLDDVDGYVAELAVDSPRDEFRKMETDLAKLLTSRRDLLDKIIIANQTCLGLLAELEGLYRQLITLVTSFETFLSERLLWTRSTPAMRLKDFRSLPQETAALIAPDQWLTTGRQMVAAAASSPVFLLVCCVTAALLWGKNNLLARLETAVRQAGNPTSYRFTLPLQAIGLTLLLALPGPLLCMGLGWQLQVQEDITDFSSAVAMALIILAYRYFFLRAFRILLAPQGLAAGFFHWQKTTINLLRREAGFLIATFLPVVFITQITFFANFRTSGSHILGRLTFIAPLAILAFFFYSVLHPRTGVWQRYITEHAHQFLVRLYPFFFFLLMFTPLVMGGLILAGYIFAVSSLVRCLINSIGVTLGLVVCHQLIERWLIQSSRRLALQRALSLRAHAKKNPGPEHLARDKDTGLIEEAAEDLLELSAESRKLLDTVAAIVFCIGLWLVWAEVMPALHIFNEYTLWGYTGKVNGQDTIIPVTLADAGLSALIGIMTLTATRHFPSLLKIVLLRHLDMTAGSRYTATTLSRYLIGGVGLLTIANILGFSWSQIQWLVAALGVGIGFGLQEIVANFISGIIILFERPIRVGDVVTIGTTDGVVTRIRIRATTIRDFDGKELLVPNKEFISGRLLNWSLTDPVIRLLLPVGIAYGSDVQQAMALMKQAAEDHTLILADPQPVVTFDSFGDNSLLLTLRCFIGTVDDRVAAKSALHQAIDLKFREAAISMAFPQRDVHLDTNKPLDIRMVRATAADRHAVTEGNTG